MNCIYCGKSAGFFQRTHPECVQSHENGKQQILSLASSMPSPQLSLDEIQGKIKSIAATLHISETEQHRLILNGWVAAVNKVLAEDPPGIDEVQRLIIGVTRFAFSANDKTAIGGEFWRLMKYAAILMVTNGIIPKFASINLPVNLEKGETVVWTFVNCEYITDKTTRKYVGSSHGVSVRLMKGVYYRRSSFTGKPVEKTERVHVDSGSLGVTDKHLYFVGKVKSFRVPYTKITSFEPFNNGIGIFRDTTNARPEIFVTQDGWFTYNLVTNLAKL